VDVLKAAPVLRGGCQCGTVRFEAEGSPLALYICHCLECRKQSASAFGMSLQMPLAGLRLVQGQPRYWSCATDQGTRLGCAFCGDCGSRLWHEPEGPAATVTIKAGALDEAVDATRAIHIWTARRMPGIVIPEGAEQYLGEPLGA
jgi:hypothetical protein